MWIRSQDKVHLIKVDTFYLKEFISPSIIKFIDCTETIEKPFPDNYCICTNDICLGTYLSKEKALQVLDDIQQEIVESNYIYYDNKSIVCLPKTIVFEMPSDEEVCVINYGKNK